MEVTSDKVTLGEQLWCYIRLRAQYEGVAFDLPPELFEDAVQAGAAVFGVVHDGEEMLYDDQEPYPGFFEEVKRGLTT